MATAAKKAEHWTDALTYSPCTDALEWLRTQPDAKTAWEKSERGDWMLYHAGKLAGEPGSDARRHLVLAACACARPALKYVKKGELRPLQAIEIAERWARGGANAPTLQEVRRVAYAAAHAAAYADAAYAYAYAAYAADAAYAAAYAADAADAAAYAAAAYAAAYAADAAAYAAAAAARTKTLAKCAVLVRKRLKVQEGKQ